MGAVAGARPSGDSVDDVRGQVRRAHARRSALRASVAALAVVVVGVGGVYLALNRDGGGSMADQPTTAAADVSPSATPSPTVHDAAWPGFAGTVTVDAHLPAARAITPEVWASAGPGWSLVSYQERWGESVGTAGPQVIYLASPGGDLYELTTVAGEDSIGVLAWEAGSTTAAARAEKPNAESLMASIDLVTGGVTTTNVRAPYMWSLASLDTEGAPVYYGDDSTFGMISVGADGVIAEFVDPSPAGAGEVAVSQLAFPGIDCGSPAPFDAESALVLCWDNRYTVAGDTDPADAHYVLARVWPADDRVQTLYDVTADVGNVGIPTRVGDRVVAATGGDGLDWCPQQYSVVADGVATPVPGVDHGLHPDATMFMPFGAAGGQFVWGMTSGCGGDESPVVVVSSDLAAGTYAVLVPYPAGRPDGEQPYRSVTGVAVSR